MEKSKGLNSRYLKNQNKGLVLRLISTNSHISRIDISKHTGLTKMAITNIINELLSEGIITEDTSINKSTSGRTPIPIVLADTSPVAIGIYLSRGSLATLITDAKLRIFYRIDNALSNETAQTITEKIYDMIDSAISYYNLHLSQRPLLGIGVSSIGTLDIKSGIILRPTNFNCIQDYPIVHLLNKRYSLPVFLENDMNSAALAEKLFGAGKLYDDFMYVGITNGIGAGIISNGQLFKSNSGFIGEIGHMSINFNGDLCSCGNRGCLELYATIPAILSNLQEACDTTYISHTQFEELYALPSCRVIFDDVINKLSIALINATNLLSPQCILIGHQGAYLPSDCIINLNNLVNKNILSKGYNNVPIMTSTFAEESPLFGSVCSVFNQWFTGKLFNS